MLYKFIPANSSGRTVYGVGCSLVFSAIAGSNPHEAWIFFCYVMCCVSSGLCDRLITCTEEFYRVCVCVRVGVCACVCVCVFFSRDFKIEVPMKVSVTQFEPLLLLAQCFPSY